MASRLRRPILGTLSVLAALVSAACAEDRRVDILVEKAPEQPVLFYHTIHAGQDQIPCAYCHFSADRSEEAGIPAVGTCMGCHRFIQGSTPEFQQNIQVLMEFAADSIAIPWVRVHSVPTFVQFPHKPHVRAGVDCAECHGDVASMEVVERVAPLTMGWCIDCHRQRGAPDDCATCHY
ncbi:MAG TPA: cytochrome c3 family protein [Gemmatimonadota bacterium]|nr:cytochrome c3 family protein [Gemmatimonadota bacterium]